ncbi:DUF7133 domain-containing protein [Roseivirga misakiensis]|uniref:Dehydrogenase n=1 Tax=Roseivirga misakiensis TaxID=1563681 RepID=A0A1E5SZ26_9BACT|nr:c-type cytochrome [Roseivirga misakiensis]OEK04366.1 dehydrogenase [Roseivirga misakiensis]
MSRISHLASCALATIAVLSFAACSPDYEEPEISLEDYQVEEGFALEVVAAEPFLEAPVAIDFDNKGRIWTVEMRGYMQTLTGESEDMPNGVISILEDKDGDGVVDHSKVFLDSLVLPRAIAHVYGGLLYAEPPNLWFVEIEDDKPGKKILVDSLYADEGNVEHQPNGLMMNIDNWIYNARSHFRYKRENGIWLKEPTSFRGQWGITKDNFGRLYYNNNSTQIMGDYVLPNVLTSNEYYQPKDGIGKVLTNNQRVYPLHATLVNRGYQKGVLDADSMLVNVTSSCGPLVYRGGQFPADYVQNAFVCAPEVNLIKRNLLTFSGPKTTAEQAYTDREFIASTDEGFRPVNLFGGPDGGMYVVDMHRGIIQHGAYMTSYLRERLAASGMDKMIGMGRILRVSHKETGLSKIPDLESANTEDLVEMLGHENGWVRDRAQQLLIHRGDQQAMVSLKKLISESSKHETIIHALYALEGLNALDGATLLTTAAHQSPEVVAHSLMLLRNPMYKNEKIAEAELLNELMARKDPTIDFYLISFFGEWLQRYGNNILALSVGLTQNYSEQYYQDALISGLSGKEKDFKSALQDSESPQIKSVISQLDNVIADQASGKKFWIYEQASLPLDDRTHGLKLYRNTCAACHGGNGQGVDGLAPPLDNSEYIKGSPKRLALVLLHGMKGPLTVNGKRYEMNAQMPGLLNNPEFTDQDIVDLMTYLSNAFGTSSRGSNAKMIKELRDVKPKNGAYTEAELNGLIDEQ